jgi:hypothetical protein
MVDSTEGKIPPMAQFLRKANLRYSGGIAMRTEWAATLVCQTTRLQYHWPGKRLDRQVRGRLEFGFFLVLSRIEVASLEHFGKGFLAGSGRCR